MMDFLSIAAATAVLAPFVSLVVLGGLSLLGHRLTEHATARLLAVNTVVGLLAVLTVFVNMLARDSHHVALAAGNWVHLDAHHADAPEYHFAVSFIFDRLSIPFVAMTYLLSGTIAAFANRYMHREPGYNRFFILYAVFQAGMVTTGLAGTIETLFFGWELVGLSSALLVGFFHERRAPVRNALRVWAVYRVSDAALLCAALSLHHMSGGGDLDKLTGYHPTAQEIDTAWPYGSAAVEGVGMLIVGGLLIFAAAGKSALLPFSGWLPRAMEGPTPSSAVFYGALSVHLGAFLLLRVSPILDGSWVLSTLVVILGLGTAAVSALVGRVQTDVKSVLSFAALTQVGLIIAEIGFGLRYIALIHLLGNACLRTLQFVRAPSAIRDHDIIESAIGGRNVIENRLGSQSWLYRFALERAYLDAFIDRWIIGPVAGLFQWLDGQERDLTDRLNEGNQGSQLNNNHEQSRELNEAMGVPADESVGLANHTGDAPV